ncbi:DnaD domain-containing protein [Oceanobacillus polygoni]|uniref:DNA replication protein n=1 Tax=Oceanobacillus polygoni TaxID=1235259 RepID=A0A9X0YWB3_9BACI|nr:DnaD domain-containing protein [Oceanobacillus polygoni]MBP2078299.1 DNA replication protein [Oceanobacillus polygoni]
MTNKFSFQQILLNQLQIPIELLSKYKQLGLNEKEVMLVLQLLRYLQIRNEFPTPYELSQHVTMDEQECANLLRKLVQKNLLSIEKKENENKQLSEAYSLDPLWEKLFIEEEIEIQEEQTIGTIFIVFEQEFGRPLSPFEIETINTWIDEDEIAPALIKAGLRESVLMGKLNFKYIDRILREWKKKGIHSVDQARDASKKFHSTQSTSKQENIPKRDTSFYYNWLEEEN